MVYTLLFFSSKCSLFHNSNVFGPCIMHILYTECAKIKKKKIRFQNINRIKEEEGTMKDGMDMQNMIRYWRDASNWSVELYTLMLYRPSLESINLPAHFSGADVRITLILSAQRIKGQSVRHFELGIRESCSQDEACMMATRNVTCRELLTINLLRRLSGWSSQ